MNALDCFVNTLAMTVGIKAESLALTSVAAHLCVRLHPSPRHGAFHRNAATIGRVRNKAESLSHTSVGQRPTSERTRYPRLKALRIVARCMRKAFSLGDSLLPLRGALPHASMRKAFGLVGCAPTRPNAESGLNTGKMRRLLPQ